MLMDKMIGRRLRELRNTKSQETMAKLAGVSRPAWAQWEAGTKRISADNAATLAVATGMSLDWLYLGKGNPPE